MNKISESSVQDLMEYDQGAALTLYIPTHRHPSPPHIQEDQTRYKNLVREGCEQLMELADESSVKQLREKLEEKLNDLSFWQSMTETLAVFANKDTLQMFHLPLEVEERVHVGKMYDLAPLLILRDMNQPFYVLSLAMHEPHLYVGDMYELQKVDIELPSSVEDALNIDEMFANSNTIRGHEGTGGLSHAIGPHGQGDSSEAGREERIKYFKIIDQKIKQHKDFDSKAPFIVAGTESEAGDYIAQSGLPHIIHTFVHGNYSKEPLHDLHFHAYAIVRSVVIHEQTETLINRYNEMIGAKRSSSNHDEIEEAARIGRIDTLMVRMFDMTADGVTDDNEECLKIRYDDEYDKKDIIELIKSVVMNGGKIIGLDKQTMPSEAHVAALYRY